MQRDLESRQMLEISQHVTKKYKIEDKRLFIPSNEHIYIDGKLRFDFNGLFCIGEMLPLMKRIISHLISLGAKPNYLNKDYISPLFCTVHYRNCNDILTQMIVKLKDETVCINDKKPKIRDVTNGNNSNSNGFDFDGIDDLSDDEYTYEINQTFQLVSHSSCDIDCGMSLLDISLRVGDLQMIKTLLSHNVMPTQHTILFEPKIYFLQFLKLTFGMNKENKINRQFYNLIKNKYISQYWDAINNLDFEYIKALTLHLIKSKCNIDNILDGNGKSGLYHIIEEPIHEICNNEQECIEHIELIKWFLNECKCNVNLLDNSETPMLVYPCGRTGKYDTIIVKLLLKYGVNLNIKVSETGLTLYQYCKELAVVDEIENAIETEYKNRNNNRNNNRNKK